MKNIKIKQIEHGNATIEGIFRNWITPSFFVWCFLLAVTLVPGVHEELFQPVFEIGGTVLFGVSALFGLVYIMAN